MKPRTAEHLVWAALALAAGFLPAWIERSSTAVQSTVVLLMLVNFALTLPGRASVPVVALCTWLAMPIHYAVVYHDVNPMMLVALIPAFIAAGGGKLAGALLDTAASRLTPEVPSGAPWHRRPLSKRFLLAVALLIIAALGVSPVTTVLRDADQRTPEWLAVVWQIMTLLGWIGLTPMILSERPVLRRPLGDAAVGVRPLELVGHLLLVSVLTELHAAAIVTISGLLAIPLSPGWRELTFQAYRIYLPLDLLAYVTILALGFVSDVQRQARDAARREAALAAESVASRLSALRARLNPHFLFNALNSVSVLARRGTPEETSRIVEGLTSLLRYVLDERRATVPLREELDFARQYLEVQRVRFGDRLSFEVSSSDRADRTPVPQLVLQPLVENAVEHGVARTLHGGSVTIAAAVDGGALRVTVEDDGPGPERVEPGNGIGLASTRERLGTLYDARAHLTLEPRSTGGTRVVLTLPLETSIANP